MFARSRGHEHERKEKELVEIYVLRSGLERIKLVEVEETVAVADVVGLADGETVWFEDTEEAVSTELTIAAAGIKHRGHVHVGPCRRVAATVHFNGPDHKKDRPIDDDPAGLRVGSWQGRFQPPG